MLTLIKSDEICLNENFKEYEEIFRNIADYDSRWRYDKRISTESILFKHQLEEIPKKFVIYFSPNKINVFPLTWSWENRLKNTSLTLDVDNNNIILNIPGEYYINCIYDNQKPWAYYNTGYWRVFAWRQEL